MAEIPAAELLTTPLTAEEARRLRADRRLGDYPRAEFNEPRERAWLAFTAWRAARGDYDDDIGTSEEAIGGDHER